MSLPIYQTITVKTFSLEELANLLHTHLNHKHPVVFNLLSLDVEQQRETIGLIENFFVSHNISYKFPYPVYLITVHEITITQMPVVQSVEQLPKFFTQKESKINVKESHLITKNRLLQQEIRNSDTLVTQNAINIYGDIHKKIFEMDLEREFYRSILNNLIKVKKNG